MANSEFNTIGPGGGGCWL